MAVDVKVHEEPGKKGKRGMRAAVIKFDPDTQPTTSRAVQDPWENFESSTSYGIVEPPFDPLSLQFIVERSSELAANIDAMVTNIPGFGWRLKRLKHTLPPVDGEPDPKLEAAAEEEKDTLENFLSYVDYDGASYIKFRKQLRKDLEDTGNCYREVVRTLGGRPYAWRHLPSFTVRLTLTDPTIVRVLEKQRLKAGGKSIIRVARRQRRFRKYVQARLDNPFGWGGSASIGHEEAPRLVWYKEYGDPRCMDWRDGMFKDPETLPRKYWASEIIHERIEATRSPYGVPRWIAGLLSILGVRSSEEINFSTFRNNNIPSMAILVSGGFLTQDSIDRMSQFVEQSIRGSDNYSRFLILEAESSEDELGQASDNVRVSIQPLTSEQHTDALFQNYDARSSDKIRQAFRIPPILLGRSSDYTRSTADTSRKMADEQVFNPERIEDDHAINRFLLQEFDSLYHEFVTNTPNVTNDEDLIRVLTGAEKTGGMTPRIAHEFLEDIMGRELPVPQGIDLDTPYSLTIAERVKNQASPTEPGQQVTAMKAAIGAEVFKRIDLALAQGFDVRDVLKHLFESGEAAGLGKGEVLEILGFPAEDL